MKKIVSAVLLLGLLFTGCRSLKTEIPSVESATQNSQEPALTETAPVRQTEPDPLIPSEALMSEPTNSKGNLTGSLVFYSDRNGNPDIFSLDLESGVVSQLTSDPAFDDSPALSPDGSRIAFLSARNDPDPHFPDLKYELYVMDSDGSNLQRLTETDAAEGHPAWSPDGNLVLFDADYDEDGFAEIYIINLSDGELTRLTFNAANDQFADWSPGGTRIAFSSDRGGGWDIYVMEADGGNQVPLTGGPDWELFPAWSPDGSRIAFTSLVPASRNTDVSIMDAVGGNLLQLTDSPGFDENPAWSPDGAKIAFQTNRDGNFAIYMIDPDGSEPLPLTESSSDELWPSWGVIP